MPPPLSPVLRFFGAGVFAIACGGALVGASVALRSTTDLAIPFLPLFVGVAVGYAVRYASNDRRTRAYRVLAVVLTYAIACATWIPDVAEHLESVAARADDESTEHQAAEGAARELGPAPAPLPGDASGDGTVELQGKAWGAYLVFGMSLLWPWRGDGMLDVLALVFATIIAWTLNASRSSRPRRSRDVDRAKEGETDREANESET